MATTIETLTTQFLTAKATRDNSRRGPKTDAAEARMERIFTRAEKLGLADDLAAAVTAATTY